MLKIFSKIAESINKVKRGKVSAIILCAGASTRFSNQNESKQMAEVLKKPVILRTLEAFEDCDDIYEIVLVVRKEDTEAYQKLVRDKKISKVSCIVVGGATRQISALKGLKRISDKSSFVAIHDGARCLVTGELISKVISEAAKHNAATAASKVTDTIKIADENGFVSKTLNRDLIWHVQTPQVFERKLYEACSYTAKEKGISVTDDCMLVENAGFKVKLVDTGDQNIKITVKEDIKLAEYILSLRGE